MSYALQASKWDFNFGGQTHILEAKEKKMVAKDTRFNQSLQVQCPLLQASFDIES
jgi:hypothetical protein